MIRIGLVGAGPWAGMFHAPMLAACPQLELSAIWARRPEAARELAERFLTVPAESFEALLDRCDAVAFTVPPDVQARLAPAAARAGKHLLLEKPLAFTLADALAIEAAVTEAGVASRLVLTYRYTAAVRDFLAATGQATVRHLRGTWISAAAAPGSPFATPWRTDPGAGLLDVGPHVLDLMDAAAGPIEAVRATRSGGVVAITTRHGGGAVGEAVLSVTTPQAHGPLEAEAVTDAGRILLADPSPTPDDIGALQAAIAADFVAAALGEIQGQFDVRRGVVLQRMIEAVQRSLSTGNEERVTQPRTT